MTSTNTIKRYIIRSYIPNVLLELSKISHGSVSNLECSLVQPYLCCGVSTWEDHMDMDSSQSKVFFWQAITLSVQDPSAIPSLSQDELLSTKAISWIEVFGSQEQKPKCKPSTCRDFSRNMNIDRLGFCFYLASGTVFVKTVPDLNGIPIMKSKAVRSGILLLWFGELLPCH